MWSFRLILVCLGLVTALLLGEAALRLCGYRPMQLDPGYRAEYKRLYRLAPRGVSWLYGLKPLAEAEFAYRGPSIRYRVNEDGLRGSRRYARPKPAGVARVLLLGDSVLFGLGVPVAELFSARLEAGLHGVEVINSGVGGYNTYTERLWLEEVGLIYGPDLIVLCYCPNDVDDPVDHFSEHTVETLLPFPEGAVPNLEYHAERLTQKTQRGKTPAGTGLKLKRMFRGTADWGVRHFALANRCAQPFSFGRRSHTYGRCLLATADVTSPESAWLRRQMEGIAATARRADLPVLFIYLPLAYELDMDNAAYEQSRRRVEEIAQACGFTVVDVFGALLEQDHPYLDVSHLSTTGHEVVAAALTPAVRRAMGLED